MSKKIVIILSLLLLVSCVQNVQEPTMYNFGTGQYEQPFRGFLKKIPFLKKTLEYPPYKWFAPDTVRLHKSFIIEFNEEAIRSKSSAQIFFVDSLYKPYKDISFYANSEYMQGGQIAIQADSLEKRLNLICEISPDFGDNVAEGKLLIQGVELDEVNEKSLYQEMITISDWRAEQEYNIPWLLWLLWLLTVILILKVLQYLIVAVLHFIKSTFPGLCALSLPNMRSNKSIVANVNNLNGNEKKEENKGKNKAMEKEDAKCPCDPMIESYCDILFNKQSSIATKCETLLALADKWENLADSQSLYDRLCPKMKNLLEAFWAIRKPSPNSYGHWSGMKGNSTFYFDGYYVPTDKNTRDGMNWAQLVAAYKQDFNLTGFDGGVRYSNGRIDLSPIAIASVQINYEDSNLDKLRSRGGGDDTVQEIAAPFFSIKLAKAIKDGGYKDFWEFKDGMHDGRFKRKTPLVIHEDYDGKTLMLVPKYLHDNWKHYGGIALVSVIVKYT